MQKMKLLKLINPVLLLLALGQILSGFLLRFAPTSGLYIYHAGNGFALGLVLLGHLILNWAWVKSTYLPRRAGSQSGFRQ